MDKIKYDRTKAKMELAERTKPKKSLAEHFIEVHLEERLEDIENDKSAVYESDEDTKEHDLFRRRSIEVNNAYNAAQELQDYIRRNYPKELFAKGNYYPKGWMVDDDRILDKLANYRILDLLNYLDKHNTDDCVISMVETGTTEGKKERERFYALIRVDSKFYNDIQSKLGMSRNSVQKYLQAFCKAGILIKMQKVGKAWLYADGYMITDWRWPRKIRFLKKDKKIIDGLRNFSLA